MNKFCHICVVKIRIDVKDAELIESFKKGNRYAFEQLVKKYQKNIYWHARRMTGNHFDADEIAQEVIITIYNKISSFRYESELSTWIYRITANKTINYLRKENIKKFFSIENLTKKDSNDIVKNLEDKQKLEKLNKLLGELPIKQREVRMPELSLLPNRRRIVPTLPFRDLYPPVRLHTSTETAS